VTREEFVWELVVQELEYCRTQVVEIKDTMEELSKLIQEGSDDLGVAFGDEGE